MEMDLRKLRHASVLAEERNFARAARSLHISQPALSQSIQRLESELGLRLFDRDQGGVALTAVGKTFVARANDLLQHARGLGHDMTLMRDHVVGDISFGLGPMPAGTFLQNVLAHLAREHPGLRVQVEIYNSDDLLDHLLRERIEFFVAAPRSVELSGNVTVVPLVKLRTSFFVRSGHALARKRSLKLDELLRFPLLSVKVPEKSRANLKRIFGLTASEEMPFTQVCDDISILKNLALTTDAILLTAYSTVAEECAAGLLVELKLPDFRPGYADIAIVSLAKRSFSPAASLVIDRLRSLSKGLAAAERSR